MAWCVKCDYIEERADLHFKEYEQGEDPNFPGIYRCVGCEGCSLEIVHISGPLPSHEHNCDNKAKWKLIVFPAHPNYYPSKPCPPRGGSKLP